MSDIRYVGRTNSIREIIDELEQSTDTEELVVIRGYRNENGGRHMEWFYSPLESKFWAAGVLQFVANRMLDDE